MKRILIALIFTALILPAAAAADAGFNVLVYPESNEIESYISVFFPTKSFDPDAWNAMQERQERKDLRKLGEALVSAYESENQEKIDSASSLYLDGVAASQPSGADFVVRLIKAGKLEFDAGVMVGDPVFLSYVCDVTDADLLVMPVTDYLQGFLHLALYVYSYGSDSADLVYEMISKESDRYPVNASLALAPSFMDISPSLVRLEGLASGTAVEIDGKETLSLDGYVMTTSGRHVISLSAQGKQDRVFATDLAPDAVSSLDATMNDIRYSGLQITSDPVSSVYLNGIGIGQTPLTLDNYVIPSSLRFSSEGYADKTVGILSGTKTVSVSMKPKWMADGNLLKEEKNEFYAGFARSLLIFGAKIALRTFNDGTNKVLEALDGAATGLLAVSIVDLVGSLVDYYRQTEYISP
ncbi:MAG: PEGA domain-containing protein [Spirochaetales bacterium]|nr:PEGA domain-containing protein [Spirochaetales bacterium]